MISNQSFISFLILAKLLFLLQPENLLWRQKKSLTLGFHKVVTACVIIVILLEKTRVNRGQFWGPRSRYNISLGFSQKQNILNN